MAILPQRRGAFEEQPRGLNAGRPADMPWPRARGRAESVSGAPLLPALAPSGAAFLEAWLDPVPAPADADLSTPLRCRLGFHRWLPVALSFSRARSSLDVAFCRCCPAVRRPARLGRPQ